MEAHQLLRLTSATLSNVANVCMRHVAPPFVRMFESMEDDGLAGGGSHLGDGIESSPGLSDLGLFIICSSFEINWGIGICTSVISCEQITRFLEEFLI